MNITSVKRIHQSDWRKKGIPFYRARDITALSKNLNIEEPIFISRDLYEEYSKISGKVQINDLLVTGVGTIGVPLLVQTVPLYFKDGNIIWFQNSNKLIGLFFLYLFKTNTVQKYIHTTTGVGTVPTYTIQSGKNTPVYITSKKEQKDIGTIFQLIDNLISLQQRKLRQLKLLKNALLKRMFTAKKSPTLRFRDFSKDWKLHKLQDITDRLDNARVPVTASKRIAGSTPYYGANGIQDYVKGYTHDGEFLLVAEDGANNINDYPVICAKGKIWVNNHTHVLQAKNKKIDILFLMYALKFLNMKKYLVGGGRSKLNAETMMKLALKLPELDEEHNIGVLIKNMDVLITQYKYRIQKINKFKQFLLQNMFI